MKKNLTVSVKFGVPLAGCAELRNTGSTAVTLAGGRFVFSRLPCLGVPPRGRCDVFLGVCLGLGVWTGEPTAWFPGPLQAPSVVPSGSDGWCGLLGLGWVAHLSVNSGRVAAFRDCQWPPSCNGFWVRALGGEPAAVAPLSLCALSRLVLGERDRGCRTRCARSRNAPI